MNRIYFLLLLFVLGIAGISSTVNGQTYEPSYCFTEQRVSPDSTYDPSNELTYCFSGQAQCRGNLTSRREAFQDSIFIDECGDDAFIVQNAICQANDFSCQLIRLTYTGGGPVGSSPQPFTVCAPTSNKCSEIASREYGYWTSFGNWSVQAVGCNVPRNRPMCTPIFAETPPVIPDPEGEVPESDGPGGDWCYERRLTSQTSYEEICYLTESQCFAAGEADRASAEYVVRKNDAGVVQCTYTGSTTEGSDDVAYCFNPVHGPSGAEGQVCAATSAECLALRNYCASSQVQVCNVTGSAADSCQASQLQSSHSSQSQSENTNAVRLFMPDYESVFDDLVVRYASQTVNNPVPPITHSDNDGDGDPDQLDDGVSVVDCAQSTDSDYCLNDPLEVECYEGWNGEQVCGTGGRNTVFTIIYKIVTGLTNVLIPLSVLAIIYGGLLFVIARGNESKISNAKKTFTNIIIGVALIIGARVIAELIWVIVQGL